MTNMTETDWQTLLLVWGSKAAKIALILVLGFLVYRLVRVATAGLYRVLDGEGRLRLEARKQCREAIARTLNRTGAAIIIVIVALTILDELGINVAPLLASAGVVGVAVGLGTQSLIKDILAGLFILLEDQFGIGDLVTIAGVTGTVEEMSLRRTTVRDFNGTLYTVPNSEIKVVSNASKDWARVIVDVGVTYETDLGHAMAVLSEVSQAVASAPEFQADVLEPPQVMGVMDLADSWITLRVAIKVKAGAQWALSRELRRRIKEGFDRAGIEIPYPQQVVHVKQ
jgi:small conductance mechanosensitive channel